VIASVALRCTQLHSNRFAAATESVIACGCDLIDTEAFLLERLVDELQAYRVAV
jgi:hypothetical protein